MAHSQPLWGLKKLEFIDLMAGGNEPLRLTWQEEQKPNPVWAQRYAPNFERAITFLEASAKAKETEVAEAEKARRQKINQLRTFLGVLFGLSLLSFGFASVALQQKKEAVKQTTFAEEQAALAEERKKKAEEQTLIAQDAQLKAEAQEKIAQDKTREAETEERNALREKDAAEKARNEELRQRNIALEALTRAEKGEKDAIYQKLQAQKQKDEAQRQAERANQEKNKATEATALHNRGMN